MSENYVSLIEAEYELGVSRPTMRKLIRRHGMVLYHKPTDNRIKLLLVSDFEKLRRELPQPEKEASNENEH